MDERSEKSQNHAIIKMFNESHLQRDPEHRYPPDTVSG